METNSGLLSAEGTLPKTALSISEHWCLEGLGPQGSRLCMCVCVCARMHLWRMPLHMLGLPCPAVCVSLWMLLCVGTWGHGLFLPSWEASWLNRKGG